MIEGQDLECRPALRHLDASEDRGKSLPGRWVNSHDLREGNVVFVRGHRPIAIRRVMQCHERTQVCNLTVKVFHTFAVGERQVLVHNVSGSEQPIEIHHNLPQAEDLVDWFKDAGLDIEDFTEPMPRDVHRLLPDGLHTNREWVDNWNEMWKQFFEFNPNAGDRRILEFLDELRALNNLPPWGQ